MGVSENVVYPETQWFCWSWNPYEKWLFHWEYTLFSDKPIGMPWFVIYNHFPHEQVVFIASISIFKQTRLTAC